ncbi:MAG: type II secretion system F family protein [Candidatus Parvarchaeota archaeon]|nr:type II secretion system F family protein [Candidatus Jingweiarchaeum tengchongense]MCW1297938.1 type II secretion system F family protein [Candidatus Jingweiarchaeum tengchongense]MCW1300606.1 type II secretion system F family protein [Candidatus Jingweiarchaeum tengchongense]MCW1304476.1 type II secretion system F family protein [Candidatus Jingweiarchaeum tengchongense]MCW1305643.1 type II secretion system F family protein [Candidatus Jingweiarchaeum tengchongense]
MGTAQLAYRIFRPIAKKYVYLIKDVEKDIKRSELPYTLEEYFALLIFSALIAFFASFLIIFLISLLVLRNPILRIFAAFFAALCVSIFIVVGFYFYPSMYAENKKRKIENALHYATIYMGTLAGTGMPPHLIFKVLSGFSEFGEISKSAEKITRGTEVFGLDLPEAMQAIAEKTVSESFKELLVGMRSTIITGGDLRQYLYEKTDKFIQDYRRRLQAYTKQLAVLTEVYMTLIIVGIIFAIVISTIMSMLGGGAGIEQMQLMIVILGLPIATVVFVMMIKMVSPLEM